MRVAVCGHVCFDTIARIDRFAAEDEKLEAHSIWTGCGGPAANAAVALRRLGHEVVLWGAVGEDRQGEWVRENLESERVRLLDPLARPGSTSLAQIRVCGASRSVVWKRGTTAPLEPDPSRVQGVLDGADLLYLDGHEVAAATAALRGARERGIPIVVDFGSLRPGVREWMPHATWVAVSPRFAAQLCGDETSPPQQLERLQEAAPNAHGVLVTAGERGSWWKAPGGLERIAARRVEVVDTTGAGDAFHAGLADAVLTGREGRDAVRWASTLAAAVCRDFGGQRGLPADRAALERWSAQWLERDEGASPG